MKVTRLDLTCFRQHYDTQIELSDGLTAIVGVNGAGKTSLVEALAFALYGTRVTRGRADDLVTRGVNERSKLKVTLTFEHDGALYRLERSLDDAALYVGGEGAPLAQGTREVTQRITQLLGMSHEEFLATYFTEQKGLEFLSGRKGAAERERFIVRMMGLDRLERMQELLRDDRREKKAQLAGLEAGLGSREELEKRLANERTLVTTAEEQLRKSDESFKQAEKESAQREGAFKSFKDSKLNFDRLSSELRDATLRSEQSEQRLKSLQAERTELAAHLQEDGDGAQVNFQGRLDALKAGLKELENQRNGAASGLEREEQVWRARVTEIERSESRLSLQIQELAQRLKNLKRLKQGSKCPTCEQELSGGFEAVRDHINTEHTELQAQLKILQAQLAETKREPVTVRELKERHKELEQKILLGTRNLERIAQREREYQRLERLTEECTGMSAELVKFKQALNVTQAELTKLAFREEQYRAAEVAAQAAKQLSEVAYRQKLKSQGELETARKLQARSESDLLEYDRRVNQLHGLKHEYLLLEESDLVLTEFRKSLNASIRPQLAELASEYLSDLTDGRYSTVVLGEDFVPSVVEDGQAKAVISGGEEDILNLCLRLALSSMLAERAGHSLALLILDEVFGSLDLQRRTNVIELLEKLRTRFEQILLITHIEEINDAVQHVITVNFDDATGRVVVRQGTDDLGLAVNV